MRKATFPRHARKCSHVTTSGHVNSNGHLASGLQTQDGSGLRPGRVDDKERRADPHSLETLLVFISTSRQSC
jgi:hypothetical protein